MRRQVAWGMATCVLWTAAVATAWSVVSSAEDRWMREVARAQAAALYQEVTDARSWNSAHGGVYVPITERTRPNPFLEVPNRDVLTTDGQNLTLINHAHMTRQIAEIGHARHDVELHLTSLNPIRPLNLPRDWEMAALESFEEGKSEWAEFATDGAGNPVFRYMAPLRVERSCLSCHARQGYEEGQIRGGLSVVVPEHHLMAIHALFHESGVLAVGLIWVMGIGLVVLVTRGFLTKQAMLKKFENQSLSDPLTGLWNRRGFLTYANHEMKVVRRLKQNALVIYIDVDGMKRVNDTWGHAEGDETLKRMAEVLRSVFRDTDIVARLGGDEFAVLSFDTGGAGAKTIEERLQRRIDVENASRTSPWVLAASTGVVDVDPAADIPIEDLLREADRQMYRQKVARHAASTP